VRHLVLPNDLAGTAEVVAFLARLSPLTYLLPGQYHACMRGVPALAQPRADEMGSAPAGSERRDWTASSC
jgi:uncharacterized Fe-S radical SAM superfamily protein PflX